MKKKYILKRNIIPIKYLLKLEDEVKNLDFNKCDPWLGNFKEVKFSKSTISPPLNILKFSESLVNFVENQTFNVISLKKFSKSQESYPHRPERFIVGKSITVTFGDFLGGIYRIDEEPVEVKKCDILIMNCTNGYSIGPKYSISKITEGTRYSLTLKTEVEI